MFYGRYAKEICDSIVAKCLTARPKTVEKAVISFLLWVELEAVDEFLVGQCDLMLDCLGIFLNFFLLAAGLYGKGSETPSC